MSYKLPGIRAAIIASLVGVSALTARGSNRDHRAHLSDDLLAHQARHTRVRARVIVHGSDSEIDTLARRYGVTVVRRLAGGAVVGANSDQVSALAADFGVDHLSGDLPVRPDMSISNPATAADQVWAGTSGLAGIGSIAGVTGQNIVVAVVDSGVSPHAALKEKIVANVSFVTGDSSTDDTFGHGTHVAGIIAGSGSAASKVTALYTGGIAPGAKLVNVRVLGDNGVGYTSDVIAGIDWVVKNRALHKIRVMNLSLGHPVTELSATDPLCEAVARAVAAGIVVVASAGNNGVAANGSPILGGVMSPGNSPYAITVGAIDTKGTVKRSDDSIAPYSSRGPTKYDQAVKPDLAAPGNKIVSLEASGSYLSVTYPTLHKAGGGPNSYMQMSGTSMAAPMISGAAALLLSGTPGLIPSQVKLALQTGATFMPNAGLMAAGAGSANLWASRKVAANGLSIVTNTLIGGLVTNASGAAFWDAGTLTQRMYRGVGIRLLSLLELPLVWLNPSLLNAGDLNLIGLLNPLASVPARSLLWGEVATWTTEQQIIWGSTIYNPEGQQIIWGSSDTTEDNQIIWGSTAPPDVR